jgi:hypothetical protein
MHAILEHLEGQLTVTLQMDDGDAEFARALLPNSRVRPGASLSVASRRELKLRKRWSVSQWEGNNEGKGNYPLKTSG